MFTKEIEDELLKLPPIEASIVLDIAWGLDSILILAKKYKKPRSTMYNIYYRNDNLIRLIREEKHKKIDIELDNLVGKALDVYIELLDKGKPEIKEKVATNILKGRGRLIDTQKIDSNVFQVTIVPPTKDDNA